MGLFLKRNPKIEKVKFVIKLSHFSLCDLKTKIYPFDMHMVTAQNEGQRNPQESTYMGCQFSRELNVIGT